MEQNKKKAAMYSILLFGLITICFEIYAGLKSVEISDGYVELIWDLTFVTLSIYWVINDARVRKIGSPFTNGFLLYILYPVMVPLYFLKIAGKRCAFLIFGLFIIFLLPEIAWVIAYYFA